MIESIILSTLQGDISLRPYLSKFNGVPAVFCEVAPENAIVPYIIFRLTGTSTDHLALQEMELFIDYYDIGYNRLNAAAASERIEYILDNKIFTHTRYETIRVRYYSRGFIEDNDNPTVIHYNTQFTIRATRKKWINQL